MLYVSPISPIELTMNANTDSGSGSRFDAHARRVEAPRRAAFGLTKHRTVPNLVALRGALCAVLMLASLAGAVSAEAAALRVRGTVAANCCVAPGPAGPVDVDFVLDIDESVAAQPPSQFLGYKFLDIVPSYAMTVSGGPFGTSAVFAVSTVTPDPEGVLGIIGRGTSPGWDARFLATLFFGEAPGQAIAEVAAFPGSSYALQGFEISVSDDADLPGFTDPPTAGEFLTALPLLDLGAGAPRGTYLQMLLVLDAEPAGAGYPAGLVFEGEIQSITVVPLPPAVFALAGGIFALFVGARKRADRGLRPRPQRLPQSVQEFVQAA